MVKDDPPQMRPKSAAKLRTDAHQLGSDIRQARIVVISPDRALRSETKALLHRSGFTQVFEAPDCESARPPSAPGFDAMLLDLGTGAEGPLPTGLDRGTPTDSTSLPPIVGIESLTADLGSVPDYVTAVLEVPLDPAALLFAVRCQLLLRFSLGAEGSAALRGESLFDPSLRWTGLEVDLLRRMARAAELRADPSGLHVERVGTLSALVALELGLDHERASRIGHAAPLHDFGVVAIPDEILLKRDMLDADEFAFMRLHTTVGASILQGLDHPVTDLAASIAWSHHERWDGSGYPRGLSGEEIPIEGRIVAVVDLFDAMMHTRGEASELRDAFALLRAEKGAAFDPDVVDALIRVWDTGMAKVIYGGSGPEADLH